MTGIVSTVPPPNTNGTTLTTANSSFDAISAITNGTLTIDSIGGLQAIDVNPSSVALYGEWGTSLGTQTDYYIATDYYLPGAPSASSKQFLRGLSGTTQNWACSFSSQAVSTTPPKSVTRNGANTAVTSAPNVYTVGAWSRVEVHVAIASGALASSITVRHYAAATDTSPDYDSTVSSGALLTFTSSAASDDHLRIGQIDTSGIQVYFRNIRVGNSAGGWLGPVGGAASNSFFALM